MSVARMTDSDPEDEFVVERPSHGLVEPPHTPMPVTI